MKLEGGITSHLVGVTYHDSFLLGCGLEETRCDMLPQPLRGNGNPLTSPKPATRETKVGVDVAPGLKV